MTPDRARWIATVCHIGTSGPAPGTLASFAALPAAAALTMIGGHGALVLATAGLFGLATEASAVHARTLGLADPGEIVIDEVIGQWIALLIAPVNPYAYALAFILFRWFDIAKPGPVGWADREVKGGLGIMLDDVIAGAMAGLVLFTLGLVWPLFRGH